MEDWDSRPGWVYMAVGHHHWDHKYDRRGKIKVGFTTNLAMRLSQLHLSLLAATPGTPKDEESLHRHFASSKAEGKATAEWYEPTEEILTWASRHRLDCDCAIHVTSFAPTPPGELQKAS